MGQRRNISDAMHSIVKLVTCSSEAKRFFSSQSADKLKKKILSFGKLWLTTILLLSIIAIYAYHVTDASTKGYYFSEKLRNQKELLFNQEIIKSEVMLEERNLWNKVWFHSTNRSLRRESIISVNTHNDAITKAPLWTETN